MSFKCTLCEIVKVMQSLDLAVNVCVSTKKIEVCLAYYAVECLSGEHIMTLFGENNNDATPVISDVYMYVQRGDRNKEIHLK